MYSKTDQNRNSLVNGYCMNSFFLLFLEFFSAIYILKKRFINNINCKAFLMTECLTYSLQCTTDFVSWWVQHYLHLNLLNIGFFFDFDRYFFRLYFLRLKSFFKCRLQPLQLRLFSEMETMTLISMRCFTSRFKILTIKVVILQSFTLKLIHEVLINILM